MSEETRAEDAVAPPRPRKEKVPRQSMPEQAPEDRARNFLEVPYGYPDEIALLEASRCLKCKKPGCVAGCPVNVDIPGFIGLIQEGKFIEAAQHLKKFNALPAVCGRVCPQEEQCEAQCVVGKKGDPVAIGRLERFVADYERQSGQMQLPELPPKNGMKVACIGAGPAGLTVAGDLVRLGYDVTIFEALQEPGGVLVYGIPEFRLPKEIVRAEVNFLQRMGVHFVLDYVVGRNATIGELMEEEGFGAVFVGSGAGLPSFMSIPGENLVGVYSANEYLTRSNLMKAYLFPRYDTPPIKRARVAVIGGGNVAMDSARTALRLGGDVTIVYRRARAEMPCRAEEIHHAEQEGVKLNLLTNPVRILGDEKHRVTGMECLRMELGEPDDSGRRRPVPVPGSEYILDVDTVIIAIGNKPNPLIAQTTPGLSISKWGTVTVDEQSMATSIPGVFAGGDIVSGAATVISAMGQGRIAARSIHRYLQGLPADDAAAAGPDEQPGVDVS